MQLRTWRKFSYVTVLLLVNTDQLYQRRLAFSHHCEEARYFSREMRLGRGYITSPPRALIVHISFLDVRIQFNLLPSTEQLTSKILVAENSIALHSIADC